MRIGSRASALALAQARQVASLLGGGEIIEVTTSGDRNLPGADKSRWVKELEQALIAGEIDLAVHSAKDLPGELAPGCVVLGAPAREAPEDALCVSPSLAGITSLDDLPAQATVGTSSLRRRAQLCSLRQDLRVVPLRGNVDTRLGKLAAGELDAIVLARAGIRRLGREVEARAILDPAKVVPAPGQGTIALEGRADDPAARAAAEAITDPGAYLCLTAERTVAGALGATCETPFGAHAVTIAGDGLRLRTWVGLADGSRWTWDELEGDRDDPIGLGRASADRLRAAGAGELLAEAVGDAR